MKKLIQIFGVLEKLLKTFRVLKMLIKTFGVLEILIKTFGVLEKLTKTKKGGNLSFKKGKFSYWGIFIHIYNYNVFKINGNFTILS